MKHCKICDGGFFVEEKWNGREWQPVLYNDQERPPEDVNCAECPLYLPLEDEATGTETLPLGTL